MQSREARRALCWLLFGALACSDDHPRGEAAVDAGDIESPRDGGSEQGDDASTAVEDEPDAAPDSELDAERAPDDASELADSSVPDDGAAEAASEDASEVDAAPALPKLSFLLASEKTWEGTGKFRVALRLDAPAPNDVQFTLGVLPQSTASAGVDVVLPSAPIVVPAGQTATNMEFTIVDDGDAEENETVVLGVSAITGASSAGDVYTLTLVDDELRAWPAPSAISVADGVNAFAGDNMSDVSYLPGATPVLWAVKNNNPILFKLTFSAGLWSPVTSEGWSAGKRLQWPGSPAGTEPDSEGVTLADYTSTSIYVITERDNNAQAQSRNSILRFETAGADAQLVASNEWNLTQNVPVPADTNLGFEALTFVPDAFLVSHGFYDESTSAPYVPPAYAHAAGVFFAGLELDGMIYAFVLDHDAGTFTRVATIASGLVDGAGSAIMGLAFDREVGQLWASCDNHCDNQVSILRIEENTVSPRLGRFGVRRRYAPPAGIPTNMNNEGIGFASEASCTDGIKPFFWIDDGNSDGHSLRSGSIPCGDFL